MRSLIFLSVLIVLSVHGAFAADSLKLTTFTSGVVDSIQVKAGQKVKQGELLLKLDQRVLIATLEEKNKHLEKAKIEMQEAEKELERAEELYERTVLSDHQLNQARVIHAQVVAQLASATADQQKAQYLLDYSQIIAPFKGKVQKIHAWPGMVVNNNEKNTTLIEFVKR